MRAYKTEIKPTEKQIEKIRQTQGVCRFVYNLFIATNQERYKQGLKYMSGYDFSKYLNHEYREEHPEQKWIWEVSSKAVKQSIMDVDKAFRRFFKTKKGYPNFKRKHGKPVGIYCPRNGIGTKNVEVQRHRIKVPIIGWIRLKEFGYIPSGYPSSITITSTAGRYYASALYETDTPAPIQCKGDGLGVDLGLKAFAVASNGTSYGIHKSKKGKKKAQERTASVLSKNPNQKEGEDCCCNDVKP